MTTITALPDAPNRSTDDPGTFSQKADAFVAALQTFRVETNLVASETNTAASNAMNAAENAQAASIAANQSANVTKWMSGVTYQNGQVVYSGINYFTYRRQTAAGSGTVDPANDSINWVQLTGPRVPDFILINAGVF